MRLLKEALVLTIYHTLLWKGESVYLKTRTLQEDVDVSYSNALKVKSSKTRVYSESNYSTPISKTSKMHSTKAPKAYRVKVKSSKGQKTTKTYKARVKSSKGGLVVKGTKSISASTKSSKSSKASQPTTSDPNQEVTGDFEFVESVGFYCGSGPNGELTDEDQDFQDTIMESVSNEITSIDEDFIAIVSVQIVFIPAPCCLDDSCNPNSQESTVQVQYSLRCAGVCPQGISR